MKKILILGTTTTKTTVISRLAENSANEVVVVNNIEAKNIVNSAFEHEPILIKNTFTQHFEPKIKNFEGNKFFDKPKRNFKKR